jgi:glyoxylase-like metal-dependent hydrolase (beta-lactamase superfamily II)
MIALEDNFSDILGKALRGLHLSEEEAARRAHLAAKDIRSLLRGEVREQPLTALAASLSLNSSALLDLAHGRYQPSVDRPENLVRVSTAYKNMMVNSYVLWDRENLDAAIFDTGAEATPLLELVKERGLNVVAIFLTHSHADHTQALTQLRQALDVEAWSSEFEPVQGTRTFRPGDLFNAGRHFIRTRHTPGHSPGGTTFIIEGRDIEAAIVGDALFAGSVGGIKEGYQESLANISTEILALPDHTILCPGHGPLTTVGLEKQHNPFFA